MSPRDTAKMSPPSTRKLNTKRHPLSGRPTVMLGALVISCLVACILPLTASGQSTSTLAPSTTQTQTPLGSSTTSASSAPRGLKRASQQAQPTLQQQQRQQAAPFYSIKNGKTSTRRIQQQQQPAGADSNAQFSSPSNNQRLRNEAGATTNQLGRLDSNTTTIDADEPKQPIMNRQQQQPVDLMENLQQQSQRGFSMDDVPEQRKSAAQSQQNMMSSGFFGQEVAGESQAPSVAQAKERRPNGAGEPATSGRQKQQLVADSDSGQSATPTSQQEQRLANMMMIDSFNQLVGSSGASQLLDDFTTPPATTSGDQTANELASGSGDKQTQSASNAGGDFSTRPEQDEDKPTPANPQQQIGGTTEPSDLIGGSARDAITDDNQQPARPDTLPVKTRQQPNVASQASAPSGQSGAPSSLSMSLDGMIMNSRPRANSNSPATGAGGPSAAQVGGGSRTAQGIKSKASAKAQRKKQPATMSIQGVGDQLGAAPNTSGVLGDKPAANPRRVPFSGTTFSSPASKGQRAKPKASNQFGDIQLGAANANQQLLDNSPVATMFAGEQQQQTGGGGQDVAQQLVRANQMTTSRLPNGDMLMSVISSDDGRERKLVMISRNTLDSLQRFANDQQQQQQQQMSAADEEGGVAGGSPTTASSWWPSSSSQAAPTVAPSSGSRAQQQSSGRQEVQQQQTTTFAPVSFSTSVASTTTTTTTTTPNSVSSTSQQAITDSDEASESPFSSTTAATIGEDNGRRESAQTSGTFTTSANVASQQARGRLESGPRGESGATSDTFREVLVQRPAPVSTSVGAKTKTPATASKQNSSQAAATTKSGAGKSKSGATSATNRQQAPATGAKQTFSQSGASPRVASGNQKSSSGQVKPLSGGGNGGPSDNANNRNDENNGTPGRSSATIGSTTPMTPRAVTSGKQVVALKQGRPQQEAATNGKSQGASPKRNKSTSTKSSSFSPSGSQQQGRPSKVANQRQKVASTRITNGSSESTTANNQQRQRQQVITTSTTPVPASFTTTTSPAQGVTNGQQIPTDRTIVQSGDRTTSEISGTTTSTTMSSGSQAGGPSTVSPRLELDRQLDELERANAGDDDGANRWSSSSSSSGSSSGELMRDPQTGTGGPQRKSSGGPVMSELDGLRASIPGEPLVDYPIYANPPLTSFSCQAQSCPGGYYADVPTQCQVFHVCQSDGRMDTFLCPNGTIFSQQHFVCVWWWQVDCGESRAHYKLNDGIYCNSMTLPTGGGLVADKDADTNQGGFSAIQGGSTTGRTSGGSLPDSRPQTSRNNERGGQQPQDQGASARTQSETSTQVAGGEPQPPARTNQVASGNETATSTMNGGDQLNENDMNQQQQQQLELLSRRA